MVVRVPVKARRRCKVVKGRTYEWVERVVYLPADFPDAPEVLIVPPGEEHEQASPHALRAKLVPRIVSKGRLVVPLKAICPFCGRFAVLNVRLAIKGDNTAVCICSECEKQYLGTSQDEA